MRGQFREYSGGIYTHPRVRIAIDDGRSFVRRTPERYDVIQASLVDTWAATAAGAYTLTENTLYTVEAFNDYLDHLTDDGVLTITRWVMDGLRLVSLAQAACESRGWRAADRLAIIQHDRVATFLLKKSPFTSAEVARLLATADRLGFRVLYAPGVDGSAPFAAPDEMIDETSTGSYAKLITTNNRSAFLSEFVQRHQPDNRRSPVLLPHHEDRESVSHRIRTIDAVRERAERADDADDDLRRARGRVRPGAARVGQSLAAARAGSPGSPISARLAPGSC